MLQAAWKEVFQKVIPAGVLNVDAHCHYINLKTLNRKPLSLNP